MYKINQISNRTLQKHSVSLPDGGSFTMLIRFISMQQGWFIEELTYNDFKIYSLRVTNSPNMLHQYKNQIPFGLACFSADNREPSLANDFSSGASSLYLVTAEEATEYAGYLSGES